MMGENSMVDVNDGNATIEINTTGLTEGEYKIQTQYTDGNYYNNASVENSILTLEPVTWTEIGVGTSTPWQSSMWNKIEINNKGEAHSNYQYRNSILQAITLRGDFTLRLHINSFNFNTWNFGLVKNSTSSANPVMNVAMGDTLNGQNINKVFQDGWGNWDTTIPVTISRQGNTYTLEYHGGTYTFTDSYTGDCYYWMDKTGSGNIFLTYIEIRNSGGGN